MAEANRRHRGLTGGRRLWAVGPLMAAGLSLAACGSSSSSPSASKTTSSSSSSSSSTTSTPAASQVGTVETASSSSYGTILVDSSGRTLYMLTADTPTKSACTGSCPAVWPPLVVTGSPTAGSGVTASLLGTITRSDGSHQVTYNGHPLYTFARDTAAGQVNGEGINHFGGLWYVLDPAGSPVKAAISAGSTTTSSINVGY